MKPPLWSIIPVIALASLFALTVSPDYTIEWIAGFNGIIIVIILIVYGVEHFVLKKEIVL